MKYFCHLFFIHLFLNTIQVLTAGKGRLPRLFGLFGGTIKTGLVDKDDGFLPLSASLNAPDARTGSIGGQFRGGKENFFYPEPARRGVEKTRLRNLRLWRQKVWQD